MFEIVFVPAAFCVTFVVYGVTFIAGATDEVLIAAGAEIRGDGFTTITVGNDVGAGAGVVVVMGGGVTAATTGAGRRTRGFATTIGAVGCFGAFCS